MSFLQGNNNDEAIFEELRDQVFAALKGSTLEHQHEELRAIVDDRESLTLLLRHIASTDGSHIHNHHVVRETPMRTGDLAPPGVFTRGRHLHIYRVVAESGR